MKSSWSVLFGIVVIAVPRRLAFVVRAPLFSKNSPRCLDSNGLPSSKEAHQQTSDPPSSSPVLVAIVAPLKTKGPQYPCLSLRFTNSNDKVLDFVLDTGANINSINDKIVEELKLPIALSGQKLPGAAGMGGAFQAANIYLLGDCQLEGLPPEQNFTFLTNLSAASLPNRPGGVCDGLLGLQFFHSFPAGVEFDWYGTNCDPPTVIFYAGQDLPRNNPQAGLQNLQPVSLTRLPTQILTLPVQINDHKMSAVIDTGSPVTILSHVAAKQAGIETVQLDPSAAFVPHRPPAVGDEALMVGGVDKGAKIQLDRSKSHVSIHAVGDNDTNIVVGQGYVYVGDLPGMAYLGGLPDGSVSSIQLPGVILGLDFLRQTYRMVLQAPKNKIWLEELNDQPRYVEEKEKHTEQQ